jgi:hypothetical protein
LKDGPFKKAKGPYIYDIKGNKYLDLRTNSNIIGFSNKRFTNKIKDLISSNWNIRGNSIYHRRSEKLFKDMFTDEHNEYELSTYSSIEEFFLRLFPILMPSYSISIAGERSTKWLQTLGLSGSGKTDNKENALVFDIAEAFLMSRGDKALFYKNILPKQKGSLAVHNCYWYPYTDKMPHDADIIILPELFSGDLGYLNVMIKKDLTDKNLFDALYNDPAKMTAIYPAASLAKYHLMNVPDTSAAMPFPGEEFISAGRIFSHKEPQGERYKALCRELYSQKILLNNEPPYYNYFPVNLTDDVIKYIKKAFKC